jgi:hypothetical protein
MCYQRGLSNTESCLLYLLQYSKHAYYIEEGEPMAWERTHKIVVRDLQRAQLWKIWQDVNHWHLWDTDIEFATMDSQFKVGTIFVLKPKGGPKVSIRLTEVEPETAFTDMTQFPLAKMYGIHRMRETADGIEVIHTVRVEGPLGFLWKKLVAAKVAAGLEEQATKMVQRAREVKLNV